MRWSDVINLIKLTSGKDDEGFPTDPVENVRSNVFANKMSAGSGEFYRAAQAGYTVDKVFEVRKIEYEDENFLEYEGERYSILRTYEKGENIELVCLARGDDHGN